MVTSKQGVTMDKIKCFWLESTSQVELSLRRYQYSDDLKACPLHGYHHTSRAIGRERRSEDQNVSTSGRGYQDSRWPTHCNCGYEFTDADEWQLNSRTLYMRSDTYELTTIEDAPVGAMWDAHYLHGYSRTIHADGICLMVRTPGGDWAVDMPSNNDGIPGPGWKRSGTIRDINPTISARPSILMPKYHGWLTNGWLESCS
jgi:hypothetical protein